MTLNAVAAARSASGAAWKNVPSTPIPEGHVRLAMPVGHRDGHARVLGRRAAVAGVDFPRARGEREERRAESRRAVEIRFFDVARGDRLDAALFVAPAPADRVGLEARGTVSEGERVAARREAQLLGRRRRHVESESRRVAGRLAGILLAAERRVVAADAVLPAVGQAALKADHGARERRAIRWSRRRRRSSCSVRPRRSAKWERSRPQTERPRPARWARPRSSDPAAGSAQTKPSNRFRARAARRSAAGRAAPTSSPGSSAGATFAIFLGQRERNGRDLLRAGLVPEALHRGLEAPLVRDQVVNARPAPRRGRTCRRPRCACARARSRRGCTR